MDLSEKRRAIRHLVDERQPADALAAYYALHHPPEKMELITYPPDARRAAGFVTRARTGIDLFRPLVTLRLPIDEMSASTDVVYHALQPGTAVILNAPVDYAPLLRALFDVQVEERLHVLELDRHRFEPVINVLVVQSTGPSGRPRFVIRRTDGGDQEVVAAAGVNWQTPYFADISVHTAASNQRQGWGRSVVAAMVNYLLQNGRTPLYTVSPDNNASMRLAQRVGFVDRGIRQILLTGILQPRP